MAIGDALSKYWTYGKVEDQTRMETGLITDELLTPSIALDIITSKIQKIAKRLNGANAPMYMRTATLTISGTANPYTIDLSSVFPFVDQIIRVVHVASTTRTYVEMKSPSEGEKIQALTNYNTTSLFGVHEGDSIVLYKGSGFTITTATDTIELKYYAQPKIGTTTSAVVVGDTAFTAASTVISAFTGMTTALVGGTFVGTDSAAGKFARTITKYVGATSFEVSSALAAEGAGTNGYIIPPNSNTYTVTRGTYVDLLDAYVPLLLDEVKASFVRFKNKGMGDAPLEASNLRQQEDIYTISAREKAQTQVEK